MEFQKDPIPTSEAYQQQVSAMLKATHVASTGLFNNVGVFEVVVPSQRPSTFEPVPMWAEDLLRFTEVIDGIWTTDKGRLWVYHHRNMRGLRAITPILTILPSGIRFVNEASSYTTQVGQSGWAIDPEACWYRQFTDPSDNVQRLEEILVNAEAGQTPPFFDDLTDFVKVEPSAVGKEVTVLQFNRVKDFVVIDRDRRQLVGKYKTDLLSRTHWN